MIAHICSCIQNLFVFRCTSSPYMSTKGKSWKLSRKYSSLLLQHIYTQV